MSKIPSNNSMQTVNLGTVLQNNGLNKQTKTRHKHGEMLVPTVATQKENNTKNKRNTNSSASNCFQWIDGIKQHQ